MYLDLIFKKGKHESKLRLKLFRLRISLESGSGWMLGIRGMTLTVGWQMNIRLLSLSPPLIGEIYTVTSGIYHSDWKSQKNKIRPSLFQVNVASIISPVSVMWPVTTGQAASPAYGCNNWTWQTIFYNVCKLIWRHKPNKKSLHSIS